MEGAAVVSMLGAMYQAKETYDQKLEAEREKEKQEALQNQAENRARIEKGKSDIASEKVKQEEERKRASETEKVLARRRRPGQESLLTGTEAGISDEDTYTKKLIK